MPSDSQAYHLVEIVAQWSHGEIGREEATAILVEAAHSLEVAVALAGQRPVPRNGRAQLRGFWTAETDWQVDDMVVLKVDPISGNVLVLPIVLTCTFAHHGGSNPSHWWRPSTFNEAISVAVDFFALMDPHAVEDLRVQLRSPHGMAPRLERYVRSSLVHAIRQSQSPESDGDAIMHRLQQDMFEIGIRADFTVNTRDTRDFLTFGRGREADAYARSSDRLTTVQIRLILARIVYSMEMVFPAGYPQDFSLRFRDFQPMEDFFGESRHGQDFVYSNPGVIIRTPSSPAPRKPDPPKKQESVLPWEEV